METVGAAAIVEVLPPERSKCERMSVGNQRLGSIDQTITTSNEAITQVPVFPCRSGPADIKSPYRLEAFYWHSEIVGDQECRLFRVRIPTSIEIITNELRHGGVWVIRELVDSPASEGTTRKQEKALRQVLEPIWSRFAIIVGERQERTLCMRSPIIPRSCRTRMPLFQKPDIQLMLKRLNAAF